MSSLALVFALDEESQSLREFFNAKICETFLNINIYSCIFDDHYFYIFNTGVGKVNAALVLSTLLNCFQIKHVFNIGTACSLDAKVKPHNWLLVSHSAYHDFDLTMFNYQYGQVPKYPVFFNCQNALFDSCDLVLSKETSVKFFKGLLTTGDIFVNSKTYKQIKKKFPQCLGADMEATAYAHVCYKYDVSFSSLKIISDLAFKSNSIQIYQKNVLSTSQKIAEVVPKVLKHFFSLQKSSSI